MQPEEVGLGTRVRVHIPVFAEIKNADGKVVGKRFVRSLRARGVVAELNGKKCRVEVLSGDPLVERRDEDGELWIKREDMTGYVPRTRTKPSVVIKRRQARLEWKAARREKLAEGKEVKF